MTTTLPQQIIKRYGVTDKKIRFFLSKDTVLFVKRYASFSNCLKGNETLPAGQMQKREVGNGIYHTIHTDGTNKFVGLPIQRLIFKN